MSTDDSIALTNYSNEWPKMAADEINKIRSTLAQVPIVVIEHIGSTAVAGCMSKPVIDIAIQISKIELGVKAIEPLESLGYVYWHENPDKTHMFFVKGMPPYGTGRTHHVHFFEPKRFQEHVVFREILKSDLNVLKKYVALKVELAAKFKQNREGYTESKSEFIRSVLKMGSLIAKT